MEFNHVSFYFMLGLPTSAIAAPQDPFDPVDELVRIYVDEMINCDCDYLVSVCLMGPKGAKKG